MIGPLVVSRFKQNLWFKERESYKASGVSVPLMPLTFYVHFLISFSCIILLCKKQTQVHALSSR